MDTDGTGDEPTQVVSVAAPVEPTAPLPAPEPAPFGAAPAPFDGTPIEGSPLVASPAPSGAPPAAAPADGAPAAFFDPAQYDPALYAAAPPPAPPRRRNILALLGLILAVPVWPVGLILSTLGLFAALNRRTGKAMAIIGLVLSIAAGGAGIALLAGAASTVNASTALDPGCADIETSLGDELATLKSDASTLESNENSATTANNSIGIVTSDLSTIETELTTASTDATHDDVKNDLGLMSTKVQAVQSALSSIQNHSTSSEGAAAAAMTTLQSTETNLDGLCSSY